jgi:hypothetical protein
VAAAEWLDGWADVFEQAGYAAATPSWPGGRAPSATTRPRELYERYHVAGPGVALMAMPTPISIRAPRRGTIDSGWREVADTALRFVQRFT